MTHAPPELLGPACDSPPDMLARIALADWLEERGEDGSGWRWLAESGREPRLTGDKKSFAWVPIRTISYYSPHGKYLSTPAGALVPDVLARSMATLYEQGLPPYPSREAACESLAAAWAALGPELQAEARKQPLPR